MTHECIRKFRTDVIDDSGGEVYNRCYGDERMVLEVWYRGQDGTECYINEWKEIDVFYCPYCGNKAG